MCILCIGDSNTWGYNPENGQRFARRWTRLLAEMMPDHEIVEEGLNGRTLLSKDPEIKERCGIDGLKMLLLSHKPVDCVVIMLGTNELKNIFESSADFIAKGVEEFIKIILDQNVWQRFNVPKILVISPILIRDELIVDGDVFGEFDENSVEQSKLVAVAIEKVCDSYKVNFMNAADCAEASVIDNIHMDEENHRKMAQAIYTKLSEILENF